MVFVKLLIFLVAYVIIQFIDTEYALAWGPGVHTAIALSSLDSASLLLPSIARVITSFPIEYMYGSLSADFFIGKGKKKQKKNPHTWEGGFKFLNEAIEDRETAYALGFLSHLAADVMAHNFFIPNLLSAYPGRGRMGHLFWEIKSDYMVGSAYTSIARGVLDMDHQICDDLLKLISGRRKNGFKAKKEFFAQSVKFSDRLHSTRNLFFDTKVIQWRHFHGYLALMLDLSRNLVNDFLKHPESSPCLLYDPMGRRNLLLAKKKKAFPRFSRTPRPVRRFDVDKNLLNL
ncbi:MAG: zinc dependent phospholipase C family protein [Deltaproteobacteria bacterium]|nr:zinc dependent phospholipase C family protein [Deltaproteobacteria bacterium]